MHVRVFYVVPWVSEDFAHLCRNVQLVFLNRVFMHVLTNVILVAIFAFFPECAAISILFIMNSYIYCGISDLGVDCLFTFISPLHFWPHFLHWAWIYNPFGFLFLQPVGPTGFISFFADSFTCISFCPLPMGYTRIIARLPGMAMPNTCA